MKKVENKIFSFYHCKKCLEEKRNYISTREYASFEFGEKEKGLQH